MIYIILTYLFSPLIYILLFFRKNKARRILVIQTAKIGDIICSTSVFRAIKKKYPYAHLSALVNPVAIELLEYNPYINEIVSLDNGFYKGFTGKMRLAKMFRNGRYDIAISLNPTVPFTLAVFWALIPVRLSLMPDFAGITYKLASVFSTYFERHRRGRLVAETYMAMLKAIGIDDDDISKDVFHSPDADDKVERFLTPELRTLNSKLKIGLAVTSGNKLKEWGAENMAVLADKLITELGVGVILIGAKRDRDVADEISSLVEHKSKMIDTVGKFNLAELPPLIERLSLFIGVDTGIAYMADALNIPIVNIAGPSDMEDQRPTGRKVFIIQKKLSCVPCSHTFKAPYECRYGHRKCITDITIEEVFQGASKLLA
ncbi:MAG: glycosyltransferase family 9 protein [Deltaproteobacteria bacterium]|nr:glycosyltransferase family 9 protein [Deltaproteobacteria bacterium]